MKKNYTRTEFILLIVKIFSLACIAGVAYLVLLNPLTSFYIIGVILLLGLALWLLQSIGHSIGKYLDSLNFELPIYLQASIQTLMYLSLLLMWSFMGAMIYKAFQEDKLIELIGIFGLTLFWTIKYKYSEYKTEITNQKLKNNPN